MIQYNWEIMGLPKLNDPEVVDRAKRYLDGSYTGVYLCPCLGEWFAHHFDNNYASLEHMIEERYGSKKLDRSVNSMVLLRKQYLNWALTS